MVKNSQNKTTNFSPEMTVLEILQNNRKTEVIFKKYEAQTGKCILCSHLFDPIKVITEKYDLDLEKFLKDLEASIVEF